MVQRHMRANLVALILWKLAPRDNVYPSRELEGIRLWSDVFQWLIVKHRLNFYRLSLSEDELYDDDYYDDDYDDEEEYGSRSYQAAKPKAPIPTPKKTPSKKASPAPSPAKAPGHKHDASTGKKGGGAASSTPLPGLAAMSRGSSAVSTASAGSAGALSAVSASEDAVTPLPITDRTPPVGEKPCLSLIIAGHVDVGKSTLMGHFLVQAGVVENRVVRKFEKESKDIGKASFAFAWVLDQNESEVIHGVLLNHF